MIGCPEVLYGSWSLGFNSLMFQNLQVLKIRIFVLPSHTFDSNFGNNLFLNFLFTGFVAILWNWWIERFLLFERSLFVFIFLDLILYWSLIYTLGSINRGILRLGSEDSPYMLRTAFETCAIDLFLFKQKRTHGLMYKIIILI